MEQAGLSLPAPVDLLVDSALARVRELGMCSQVRAEAKLRQHGGCWKAAILDLLQEHGGRHAEQHVNPVLTMDMAGIIKPTSPSPARQFTPLVSENTEAKLTEREVVNGHKQRIFRLYKSSQVAVLKV